MLDICAFILLFLMTRPISLPGMLKGDSCTSYFAREKRKNMLPLIFFLGGGVWVFFFKVQVTNASHNNFVFFIFFLKIQPGEKKMFKSKCLKGDSAWLAFFFFFSPCGVLGCRLKEIGK